MTSTTRDVLMVGVGGQGIIMASDILTLAAMHQGFDAKKSEIHGMSQRGGSVVSHFKMGDSLSSMVVPGTADVLVGLESTEGLRNLECLRPGGVYLVNSADLDHMPKEVVEHLKSQGVKIHHFDADACALKEGKPLTANLYLIGFLAGLPDVQFSEQDLRGVISKLTKPAFLEDNFKAFDAGLEASRSNP